MIKAMKPGSVLVDVAIDQGGCSDTSKITTHENPTYVIDQVVHYCVANMPGAVAHTATEALNNATLPYIIALANNNIYGALKKDKHLLQGLNICEGKITCKDVSDALSLEYMPAEDAIKNL